MGKTKAKPAADAIKNPLGFEDLPTGGLSPVELHALGLIAKDAARWRDLLEPGSHAFDFNVHLQGELHVGQGQTSTVDKKPNTETALARVFDALGPKTREKLLADLTGRPTLDGDPAPSKQAQELAKLVIVHLTTQTTQTKRGNVSGICDARRI